MNSKELELQEVKVGSCGADGDYRKMYRFVGVQVAYTRNHQAARSRDDRGCDKTLYQIGENRYIVHIKDWSKWENEIDTSYFYSADDSDAPLVLYASDVTEFFPELANEAKISVPVDITFEGLL